MKEESFGSFHPSAFILHPCVGAECCRDYIIEMTGQSWLVSRRFLVGPLIGTMANAGAEYTVSVSDRVRIPAHLIDIR